MDLHRAIFLGADPPPELIGHIYRKMFGLSWQELQDEPLDQIFLSTLIESEYKKKAYEDLKREQRKYNGSI